MMRGARKLALVEYVSGGRVAVITLNSPHADNAITTELAAQLIEIFETVVARPSVRCAIITGAGDRAFSVGGDLYQRKSMTKEEWLRQRLVFDRVLYTLRQMRRPIIAAVHGMAYGGGCELLSARTSSSRPMTPCSASPRRWSACPPAAARRSFFPGTPTGEGDADADDRGTNHRTRGAPARMVNESTPRPNLWAPCSASRRDCEELTYSGTVGQAPCKKDKANP